MAKWTGGDSQQFWLIISGEGVVYISENIKSQKRKTQFQLVWLGLDGSGDWPAPLKRRKILRQRKKGMKNYFKGKITLQVKMYYHMHFQWKTVKKLYVNSNNSFENCPRICDRSLIRNSRENGVLFVSAMLFLGISVFFYSKYDTKSHWILTGQVVGFYNQCDLFPVVNLWFFTHMEQMNDQMKALYFLFPKPSLCIYTFKDTVNLKVNIL